MSKKKPTEKEHYIPIFYLHNFCGEDGKLTRYTSKYCSFSRKYPEQICYGKFLYETPLTNSKEDDLEKKYLFINKIENHFSMRETEYAACLREIIDICLNPDNINSLVCSHKNRSLLVEFIANLCVRNPISLLNTKMDEMPSEYRELPLFSESNNVLNKLGFGDITESLIVQSIKEQWLMTDDDKNVFSRLKKQIEELRISFWVSKGTNFIFSDYPVFVCLDQSSVLRMILLPIHPKCCVIGIVESEKTEGAPNNRIRIIENDLVYKTNITLINSTEKPSDYLYAYRKEDIKNTLSYHGEKR